MQVGNRQQAIGNRQQAIGNKQQAICNSSTNIIYNINNFIRLETLMIIISVICMISITTLAWVFLYSGMLYGGGHCFFYILWKQRHRCGTSHRLN